MPDLRDTLDETAMEYRRVAPWLFVWPDAWVGGPAELREFYEVFEFPIIQFTDKVLYCNDKQQLAGFENSYLLCMWHRRIMTGRPRRLRIPWRSYPEEGATLRDQLRHLMRHSLGREVPAPDLALG